MYLWHYNLICASDYRKISAEFLWGEGTNKILLKNKTARHNENMMMHLMCLLEYTTQRTLSVLATVTHVADNITYFLNLSFLHSPAFLKVEFVVL